MVDSWDDGAVSAAGHWLYTTGQHLRLSTSRMRFQRGGRFLTST